jgi:hypothetical protein
MIVLHAGVDDGQFLLWGERPRDAEVRPRAHGVQTHRRRAATVRQHAPPLVYNAGIEPLAAALTEVGVDLLDDECHSAVAIGWFPTLDNTPLASSPLIAELPMSRAQTMLRPWSVTTLGLSPKGMIDLLTTAGCLRVCRKARGCAAACRTTDLGCH